MLGGLGRKEGYEFSNYTNQRQRKANTGPAPLQFSRGTTVKTIALLLFLPPLIEPCVAATWYGLGIWLQAVHLQWCLESPSPPVFLLGVLLQVDAPGDKVEEVQRSLIGPSDYHQAGQA